MKTFQDRFIHAFMREQERRLVAGEQKLTKTDVWKAAEASSGAFSQWFDGTTGMRLSTCFKVSNLLRVNPHWLYDGSGRIDELSLSIYSNNVSTVSESPHTKKGDSNVIHSFPKSRAIERADHFTIPQYDTRASMGHGAMVIHDQPGVIHNWDVSREWIEKNVRSFSGIPNLCIVTGFGDSMRPKFNPGDPLLVDQGVKSVVADGIYFFRVGDECYIKQLQKIPTSEGTVYLARSANTDYKDFEITQGMEFEVLGRVLRVWCGTDF